MTDEHLQVFFVLCQNPQRLQDKHSSAETRITQLLTTKQANRCVVRLSHAHITLMILQWKRTLHKQEHKEHKPTTNQVKRTTEARWGLLTSGRPDVSRTTAWLKHLHMEYFVWHETLIMNMSGLYGCLEPSRALALTWTKLNVISGLSTSAGMKYELIVQIFSPKPRHSQRHQHKSPFHLADRLRSMLSLTSFWPMIFSQSQKTSWGHVTC